MNQGEEGEEGDGHQDLVSHPEGEEEARPAVRSDARTPPPAHGASSSDEVALEVPRRGSQGPFPRSRLASAFEEPPSTLPLFSEREAKIVKVSNRLLQAFWLFGTIFTGASPCMDHPLMSAAAVASLRLIMVCCWAWQASCCGSSSRSTRRST